VSQSRRKAQPDALTPREEEVLRLVSEGRTDPEIADELGIALETVNHHVSEILAKLNVATRDEATVWQRRRSNVARWVIWLAAAAVVLSAALGVGLISWGLLKANGYPHGEASKIIESSQGRLTDEQANSAQMIVTMPSSNQDQEGDVWLAKLDGTVIEQLPVASGVQQRDFIRVAPNIETGNPALYYAAGQWDTDKTIFRLDLTTQVGEEIGTIPKCCTQLFGPRPGPRTDVSPDGRYIILFVGQHLDSLIKHDLKTGEDVPLPTPAGIAKCNLSCQYWNIEWSPSGAYFLASYYGVDPEPAQTLLFDVSGKFLAADAFADGVWSPCGDAICDLPNSSGKPFLEIRRAPDWKPQRFLEDLALNAVTPADISLIWTGPALRGCTWTDDEHVAVWQSASPNGQTPAPAHLIHINVESGDFTQINIAHDCHFESLMSAGSSLVIMRNTAGGQTCGGPSVRVGPNDVLDVATGIWAVNTEPGTVIEAVIPAGQPLASLRSSQRNERY
jgi:DNA-binding CsgD family transcriptional regulator